MLKECISKQITIRYKRQPGEHRIPLSPIECYLVTAVISARLVQSPRDGQKRALGTLAREQESIRCDKLK